MVASVGSRDAWNCQLIVIQENGLP